VLQLRCDQSEHVFTTSEEFQAGGIVDFSLSFVEALLSLNQPTCIIFQVYLTYKSILLASRAVSSVRFQETAIGELYVGFNCTGCLSFALWSESDCKDCSKEEAHDAQSDRELMEWITGNES